MNIPKLRFKDNNGNDYPQWEKKLIKDILKIYHGKDYKNEPNEKKLYPVLGTGGIITYIDKFLCDWECVLIGRKGTINKPQYMKTPFWSVDTLFYSKPKLKQNPKFQYYLFQNINWKIYDESTGVPSLSASTIEHINRFIPTYAEQEKIASFFSTIDKKIENLTNTITSLENQKKGLLQQIFSQKLRFKDKNGNNYPNWEKKKLGKLLSITSSKRVHEADWTTSGIPFYRARDIVSIFNNKPISKIYISEKLYEECSSSCGKISENDLLVTGVGTIGIPYLVKKSDKFYFKDGNIIWLKNSPAIYGKYLFYIFISSYVQKQINMMTGKGTVGTYTIKNAKDTNILLPCLEEQTKIADFLSEFDRKLDNQKAQLEHWQQIKKGLLQQMFV
ncbi:restriction endonuclease subunit S [uncultured Megamonas sp.]|uniref:restriction endonuclease subunit S n=1 Tax=uncultured Megamonas sp. TaxID=286140 RepID=UPI002598F4B4|nr:restriction endonuclease subunit S [uncultured Megamonas sp.]